MKHRQRPARRTRTLQRRLHLLAAVPVIACVYVAPELDPAFTTRSRGRSHPPSYCRASPRQWPRLRRLGRRLTAEADGGRRTRAPRLRSGPA